MADGGCVEDMGEQVCHTLTDSAFGNDMLSVLNGMRAEGVLLDVTVVAGEEEFRAHSTVLAYGSDYFRRLFASGMKESQDNCVELKDPSITAEGFRLLLNFLYSGELLVSSESVYDVLLVANHLQIQSVMKICYEFISQNMRDAPLDLANYTKAEKLADAYGLTTLHEKVNSALSENFLELSTSDEFLRYATADQLVKMLKTSDLVAPSELQVYEAVVRWLMHDEHSRMPHAAEVLSHVRFALMDQNTLSRLLQTDMGAEESCRQLIMEAMAYHSYPSEVKQGIDWPRSKPRTSVNKKVPLALSSRKAFEFAANGWMEQKSVCPPGQIHAATVVGNVLYAVNQSSFQSYDPATNTWKRLPPPDCGYESVKMIAMDTRLFLVAGNKGDNCSSNAYCYEISEGRWTRIPSIPRLSDGVALASCQGVVFAIGGNVHHPVDPKKESGSTACASKAMGFGIDVSFGAPARSVARIEYEKEPVAAVDAFFPPKNSWKAVSPTTRPHAEATAMVQVDTIYIAGGNTFNDDKICNSTTVEMCRVFVKDDVAVSGWSVIPQPLCVHRFVSKVAVIDRKAYFILGGQMHFTGELVDHDRTS
ncbi:KLHL2 [Branchiostoma lanceolatum]|uniref:KLHL2 protein n=1 Tax=Branchiostoma lanceolatum TaxID=7740 RepID=A0A8J9YNI1_BRALA|nr:KLHL2 [Branchiostoma lanceolatum]